MSGFFFYIMDHYIFGYGSLVNQEALQQYLGRKCGVSEARLCQLRGFRRCWNVAMDNQVDLPEYKYYTDPETGDRPGLFVAFLNIRPSESSMITGILFQVNEKELRQLDLRERNYQRIEVTDQIKIPVTDGKVWAYRGTTAAEERYLQGMRTETTCISEEYYRFVYDCFCCCGEKSAQNYMDSTDVPEVPLRRLERVDFKTS